MVSPWQFFLLPEDAKKQVQNRRFCAHSRKQKNTTNRFYQQKRGIQKPILKRGKKNQAGAAESRVSKKKEKCYCLHRESAEDGVFEIP